MIHKNLFNRKFFILISLFFLVLSSLFLFPRKNQTLPTFIEKVSHYITNLPSYKSFSGTIFVSSKDKVLINKGYGMADHTFLIKNTPYTKFWIGSISKAFTAVLIMQLYNEGRLNLQENLKKYIPNLRLEGSGCITVEHLLNHTSGIPHHYIGIPDFFEKHDKYFYTRTELVDLISGVKLLHNPGEKTTYSSLNYSLLGIIIENITNKSYSEVLQQRILNPLTMKNTGVENNICIKRKIARGYARGLKGLIQAPQSDMSSIFAAGDMYSTASDLSLFLNAIGSKSDQLLPWNIKNLMIQKAYGFGVVNPTLPSGETLTVLVFGGSAYGFTSMAHRVLEKDWNLIALCNIQSPWIVGEIVERLGDFIIEKEVGIRINPPQKLTPRIKKKKEPEKREFKEVCGWYKSEEGAIFGIVEKNTKLYRMRPLQFEVSLLELIPEDCNTFRHELDSNIKYKFHKSPRTMDYHIKIESSQKVYHLKKINPSYTKDVLDEFCGYFTSVELQRSYHFYNRNGKLRCDSFLNYGIVDFIYLNDDLFGFDHGFLQFRRNEDGKIIEFKLRRQDLDGFFGSRFVKK